MLGSDSWFKFGDQVLQSENDYLKLRMICPCAHLIENGDLHTSIRIDPAYGLILRLHQSPVSLTSNRRVKLSVHKASGEKISIINFKNIVQTYSIIAAEWVSLDLIPMHNLDRVYSNTLNDDFILGKKKNRDRESILLNPLVNDPDSLLFTGINIVVVFAVPHGMTHIFVMSPTGREVSSFRLPLYVVSEGLRILSITREGLLLATEQNEIYFNKGWCGLDIHRIHTDTSMKPRLVIELKEGSFYVLYGNNDLRYKKIYFDEPNFSLISSKKQTTEHVRNEIFAKSIGGSSIISLCIVTPHHRNSSDKMDSRLYKFILFLTLGNNNNNNNERKNTSSGNKTDQLRVHVIAVKSPKETGNENEISGQQINELHETNSDLHITHREDDDCMSYTHSIDLPSSIIALSNFLLTDTSPPDVYLTSFGKYFLVVSSDVKGDKTTLLIGKVIVSHFIHLKERNEKTSNISTSLNIKSNFSLSIKIMPRPFHFSFRLFLSSTSFYPDFLNTTNEYSKREEREKGSIFMTNGKYFYILEKLQRRAYLAVNGVIAGEEMIRLLPWEVSGTTLRKIAMLPFGECRDLVRTILVTAESLMPLKEDDTLLTESMELSKIDRRDMQVTGTHNGNEMKYGNITKGQSDVNGLLHLAHLIRQHLCLIGEPEQVATLSDVILETCAIIRICSSINVAGVPMTPRVLRIMGEGVVFSLCSMGLLNLADEICTYVGCSKRVIAYHRCLHIIIRLDKEMVKSDDTGNLDYSSGLDYTNSEEIQSFLSIARPFFIRDPLFMYLMICLLKNRSSLIRLVLQSPGMYPRIMGCRIFILLMIDEWEVASYVIQRYAPSLIPLLVDHCSTDIPRFASMCEIPFLKGDGPIDSLVSSTIPTTKPKLKGGMSQMSLIKSKTASLGKWLLRVNDEGGKFTWGSILGGKGASESVMTIELDNYPLLRVVVDVIVNEILHDNNNNNKPITNSDTTLYSPLYSLFKSNLSPRLSGLMEVEISVNTEWNMLPNISNKELILSNGKNCETILRDNGRIYGCQSLLLISSLLHESRNMNLVDDSIDLSEECKHDLEGDNIGNGNIDTKQNKNKEEEEEDGTFWNRIRAVRQSVGL